MKSGLRLVSHLSCVMLLASCGGGGGGSRNSPPAPTPPPPPPVVISPATATVDANATQVFTASGGTAPYTFTVSAGTGAIDGAGLYTAPAAAGTATIRVQDSGGRTATAAVTLPGPLTLTPLTATVGANTVSNFTAAGGRTPYGFSIVAGGGSITNAGAYTAPAAPGSSTIRVTDNRAAALDAAITINPALGVRPAAITMTAASGRTFSFSAFDGVPPYTYTVSGPGTVDNAGLYHAGTASGIATISLRDSQGTVVNATVDSIWVRTNGLVQALTSDASSLYVGGAFNAVNAYEAPNSIVLDASSGDPMLACNLSRGFDGPVRAVVNTGTHLYLGGSFTQYRGTAALGLARLDASTCALDTTFTQAQGFHGEVNALAVLGDAVFAGGTFDSYRGTTVSNLAKLNAVSGALDTTFTQITGVDGPVNAIVASGSAVFVGGDFYGYRGQFAQDLFKVDASSGALDAPFMVGAAMDGRVNALLLDGTSLYVGGYTNDYRGQTASGFLKVNTVSGALDTNFTLSMGINGEAYALAVSASAVYAAGEFFEYRGTAVNHLIKVNKTTGVLDGAFAAAALPGGSMYSNPRVNSLALNGNALYLGGDFNTYGTAPAHQLARINATTGTLDTGFTQKTGFDWTEWFRSRPVTALSVNGNVLVVGGTFTTYRGMPVGSVAKLDLATGVADAAFSAAGGANSSVRVLSLLGDSLFVGGAFTEYNGGPYAGLVKVDTTTGAVNTTFNQPTGLTGQAFSLAQLNGQLYVGGALGTYRGDVYLWGIKLDPVNGNADPNYNAAFGFGDITFGIVGQGSSLYLGGQFYPSVAKFDAATGAPDPAWSGVQTSGTVADVAVQGTSVYYGGQFSFAGNTAIPAQSLVKLDSATGAVDTTFTQPNGISGGWGVVKKIALQGNALFVGGQFDMYRNASASSLLKLDATSGAPIASFLTDSGPNGPVHSLLPATGALWVGGDFTRFRGAPGYYLVPADLNTGLPLDP